MKGGDALPGGDAPAIDTAKPAAEPPAHG